AAGLAGTHYRQAPCSLWPWQTSSLEPEPHRVLFFTNHPPQAPVTSRGKLAQTPGPLLCRQPGLSPAPVWDPALAASRSWGTLRSDSEGVPAHAELWPATRPHSSAGRRAGCGQTRARVGGGWCTRERLYPVSSHCGKTLPTSEHDAVGPLPGGRQSRSRSRVPGS
ncbi:hypothetical protein H1C71_037636, partial [Ictidomys tridecemlineatus]